jgi:hypothetical protein
MGERRPHDRPVRRWRTTPIAASIAAVDDRAVRAVLRRQAGVVGRRQLHELGCRPHDIQRLIRRRALTRIHPGVYVEHTGPLSWLQRAWAAVLALWPAALCAESALRAEYLVDPEPARYRRFVDRDDGALVHVAVATDRHLVAPTGVRVHRLTGLPERVLWNQLPPRLEIEHAALDAAANAPSDYAALEVLAEVCRTRRTTAARLATTLAHRTRIARRAWLSAVLTDLAAGTTSVLEHGYLHGVERAHGLPRAARQVRATAAIGVVYRDAEYPGGVLVELDGRLVHNTVPQRDADFERDLDAAVDGHTTVRLSWGQVFDRPCGTAAKLARLLRRRGWTGQPRPCCPTCPIGRDGG